MDTETLARDIASALEDHALIHWEQQGKTAQIVRSFLNEHIKRMVKEFYD